MEVNHKQLKQLIVQGFENKVPLDVKGAPGIGKSEQIYDTAKNIAESKKRKFIFWNRIPEEEKEGLLTANLDQIFIYADLRLAQFDQTDLKGFPNTKSDYAKWVPTILFKVLSRPQATGLIFFDELNQAAPSVVASAYQIINDHLIGETPISKGVYMISAGNRLSDTNNAFDDPAPLNNRRANVVLTPPLVKSEDGEDWTAWAHQNGIDSRIIGYLNAYETKIFKFEEDNIDPSFPTPRTWSRLSKMIKDVKDYQLIKLYAASLVGEGIGTEFTAFIRLTQKINVREILNKPELIKKYHGPEYIDQKYSIVSTIAEMYTKEPKILDQVLALCNYLEPEFGMFLLRSVKGLSKEPSKFGTELTKCKNWNSIADQFEKYLM